MPTYEFQCIKCKRIVEITCEISQRPSVLDCPECGGISKRIISQSAIQDDHPRWLTPRLLDTVVDSNEGRIESRSELNAYCKENGIVENPK